MKINEIKIDAVKMDVPLFIRLLEYAREDAKTDMDLHKMTERVERHSKTRVLTMDDYDFLVTGKIKGL